MVNINIKMCDGDVWLLEDTGVSLLHDIYKTNTGLIIYILNLSMTIRFMIRRWAKDDTREEAGGTTYGSHCHLI